MTTFHVHEDILVENVKPKQQTKTSKVCADKNKHRAVLQPLGNYQQNSRKPVTGRENCAVPTKQNDVKAPHPNSDLFSLKPILKRVSLCPKTVQTDPVEKEYEGEVWQYLYLLEKKMNSKIRPYYMSKQLHLSWEMRGVLIDWLVSVAEEYNLSNHTLHLSVSYLDRFLSNLSVIREKFQLVGATAMMLAGKIEEIYPPDTREWSYLTGDTFTIRQIVKMEQLMLKVLNYEMHPPTILDFIKHLCAKHRLDSKTMYLAMYFSELVLLEGEEYLQYFPSKLAAASLVLARHTLFKAEPWTRKMEETAGYSLKQLSPVVQRQLKTFKGSPFKEQQAVQKKYASDKYQRVALLKPRVLVLDEEE